MIWEITIRRAENGYICSWKEEGEEDNILEKQKVFEESEETMQENLSELACMKDMLLFIKEYFGVHYSKHNKVNLNIDIEEIKNEKE